MGAASRSGSARAESASRRRPGASRSRRRARSVMSSTGTTISRSSSFGLPASAISHLRRGPTRNRAIRSSGRCVAERPIRWRSTVGPCSATRCERRSRVSARWAPRFDWATAWISSTITASAPVRISRAPEVMIRYSDSGVVIRMSGGFRRIAWRSRCGVSPVRSPTEISRADPLQRRAQVPLDVVGERLQRRDVDDPHALARAARAREPGGRSPRGRRPASFPTRWGRRSACSLRRRSSASPSPAQAWAPRTTPRTSASRAR